MTDYVTLPVATICSPSHDYLDMRVAQMSEGRAPHGLGRLVARYADDANVAACVVLAIAMKETGRFRYGGTDPVFSADPSYHNFGGIKTTDSTRTHHFMTDALGAMGLVAHVAWYAHPDHVALFCSQFYDPRHFGVGHRGGLRVLRELGSGIWNGSPDYGLTLAPIVAELHAFAPH